MKVFSYAVLVLTSTYSVTAEIVSEENGVIIHNFGRHRNLAYVKNKISWPECVELKMTVEECHELIETELAMGHVLSNVSASKSFPPAPDAPSPLDEYYFRFTVPTNYMAQVTGDEIDGKISYDLKWNLLTGPVDVGPWDCKGLTATQCCTKIKGLIKTKDVNNKYMDCWVKEESPIPYVKRTGVSYCAWEWDKVGLKYVAKEATLTKQKTQYDAAKAKLAALAPEIQGYIDAGAVSYSKLVTVSNSLHLYARMAGHLEKAAADMDAYLHAPNKSTTVFTVNGPILDLFSWTVNSLEKFVAQPFVYEHHVVIHSHDEQGSLVQHVPQISTPPMTTPCVP